VGWLESAAYSQAAWLFVRGFGAVCVIAFLSLLVQVRGLFGERGILPIREHSDRLRRMGTRWWRAPSLFRARADDTTIVAVGVVGLVAAVLVTVDIATIPALVVVWLSYLSFTTSGRDFLAFQWDVMLIEVAVIALLLAVPGGPHPLALLLAWVFAFRFMFMSGIAKLLSGDRTWRDLTAVAYHYETQPLPTRLAWHAHQLPHGAHRATTLAVLVIEIGVPVLLFAPERIRLAAIVVLVILQVGIVATGNYGFFNLLSLVILVPLVPDRQWRRIVGDVGTAPAEGPEVVGWLVAVAAVGLLVLNVLRLVDLGFGAKPIKRVLRTVMPWRLANRYGLFAVMTTSRPELIVEGSSDGATWVPYRFRWKPGDPKRAPRLNAPHQPRLDWQLWFAALGDLWSSPWVASLLERLLEGSPDVTRLLADNPFPDEPPRFVRVRRDVYTYTDRRTRRETGWWWEVASGDVYAPTAWLEEGRIVFAR
jgi:lipase maturation factor 1